MTHQGLAPEAILILLGMIGLVAGGIQIGLGLAGVGRLIRFIPYPVVSGYLSGVGLIIIGGQIPKFLGAPAGATLIDALKAPGTWMWQSIAVGSVAAAAMVLTPWLTRRVPAAIVALLSGIAAYFSLALFDPSLLSTEHNPLLVGRLESGGSLEDSLRQHWLALTSLGWRDLSQVLAPALTLAALLSIDTLKTCVVIDAMTSTHHDSNRELVGQGIANITSAIVGGIPGAGTMGASLISVSSGGTTRRAGMIEGGLALLAFLVLASVIAWVPIAALAAILMVIGFRMIDRHSIAFFFTPTTRLDFLVIVAVIAVALFGNLIAASGVGVALAILLFIREQTKSSVVRNRIEGNEIYSRRARRVGDADAPERNDLVVLELQGSLFFGTASQLQAALEPETASRKYVILSMRRVQSLDVTATHVLEQIKDRLEANDAYLVFCDIPKGLPSGLKMKRYLKDTGVVRPTNRAFAFRQLDEALDWVEARALEEAAAEQHPPKPLDLREMPIFADRREDELAALEALVETRSVRAGKKIFKAGAHGHELFIIRSGAVKLGLPIGKKETYHLATLEAGAILGGIGFLDDNAHPGDALALTDTELYVISSERFQELIETHRGLAFYFFKIIARNLGERLRMAAMEIRTLRH
jgi:SulP family sulfate permease